MNMSGHYKSFFIIIRFNFLFVLFLYPFINVAQIRLPSVISSNMVLQQNSSVKLWGWGNPNERVRITNSWNGNIDSTRVNENAKWEIIIKTPAAGGPHTITIQGRNTTVLENVLIGEVWVSSGQSNMEYNFFNGIKQIGEELQTAFNTQIRFFNVLRTTAESPQDDVRGSWVICDSNTIKSFSAVAYFFGKKIHSELNIPVGLINVSWGGTPAETWTPAELINNDPLLQEASKKVKWARGWPITPGYTYNGMIAPIINFSIAGAIWYQGESNITSPSTYHKLFQIMINSWRNKWKKDFPFYFVQLAPFKYGNQNVGALIREAQAKTLSLPKTGMVVTTDIAGDTLDIHPKNKRDVGLRLAGIALTDHYGKPVKGSKSPLFKNMEIEKDKIILSFDHGEGGFMLKGKTVTGLMIAGEDRIFYPAKAKFKDNKIIAWNKEIKNPVAVRYAFSNTVIGNLFSADQLPVGPFRTDDWDVDTSVIK